MTNFTMATLKTPNGPKVAIGLNKQCYLLSEAQPLLRDVTVLPLKQQWDISFPTLQAFADAITAGKITYAREVNAHDADLFTPVKYPNKITLCNEPSSCTQPRCAGPFWWLASSRLLSLRCSALST